MKEAKLKIEGATELKRLKSHAEKKIQSSHFATISEAMELSVCSVCGAYLNRGSQMYFFLKV